MRVCLLIREQPCYRRDAFAKGLRACGWDVSASVDHGADALVIWNRYGVFDRHATEFERRGKPVLVAENGYLGREWNGGTWYALAQGEHNGFGQWPRDLPRALPENVLRPWRTGGREVVVLAQRGIGSPRVAQPPGWHRRVAAQLAGHTDRPIRIREHPGERGAAVPLEQDLEQAWACVTWGSGAALKALTLGVPVFYAQPMWIGGAAAHALCWRRGIEQPYREERETLLQRLGTAMWRLDEIERGEPFRYLLPAAGQGQGAASVRGVCGRLPGPRDGAAAG